MEIMTRDVGGGGGDCPLPPRPMRALNLCEQMGRRAIRITPRQCCLKKLQYFSRPVLVQNFPFIDVKY